jgi:hypothetical protein
MDVNNSCEDSSISIPLNLHNWNDSSISLEVLTPPTPKATPPFLPPHGESEIPALTLPPPAFHGPVRDSSTSSTTSRSGRYLPPALNVLPATPAPAMTVAPTPASISATSVAYQQETLAQIAFDWLRWRGNPAAFGGRGPIDLKKNVIARRVSHAFESSLAFCRHWMRRSPVNLGITVFLALDLLAMVILLAVNSRNW